MRMIFINCPNCATLTHWARDKMAVIFQTTFLTAFPWMEMFEFRLKFHINLFLMVQLIILQHWFRKWPGADQATSHFLNQWWPTLVTHICVSRSQWLKGMRFEARISNVNTVMLFSKISAWDDIGSSTKQEALRERIFPLHLAWQARNSLVRRETG